MWSDQLIRYTEIRKLRQVLFISIGLIQGLCGFEKIAHAEMLSSNPAKMNEVETSNEPLTLAHKAASQQYIQTLAKFILDRNRASAERGFQDVLTVDPRFGPASFNLGVLYEVDRKYAEAKSYFNKYLAIEQNGRDANRARSDVMLLERYLTGKVAAEDERHINYYSKIQHARIFLQAGLFREAIAAAGEAQSLDGARWEAYGVVALCLAKQHRNIDAKKWEQLAIQRTTGRSSARIAKVLDGAIQRAEK